jgi:hypothetical protein
MNAGEGGSHPFPPPAGANNLINRMTGEPNLPVRTANQYLARYWFAVGPDIGSRFAAVKLVSHRSCDLSQSADCPVSCLRSVSSELGDR